MCTYDCHLGASYTIDPTKYQAWNITHHATHITYHILNRNFKVLKNIMDQNIGGLWKFIKTDPDLNGQIFFWMKIISLTIQLLCCTQNGSNQTFNCEKQNFPKKKHASLKNSEIVKGMRFFKFDYPNFNYPKSGNINSSVF